MKPKVIAVTNQKGGVGKTTTATALAAGLNRLGHKTLLIDMDPQANTTDTYRALVQDQETLYDVLVEREIGLKDAIQSRQAGDIVAGDPFLTDAEEMIAGQGREFRLKEALDDYFNSGECDYEFIVLDTPPNLGILLTNSLTAADSCIIPVVADRYTMQGLSELDKSIARVRRYSNADLAIDGILVVKTNPRTKMSKKMMEDLPDICKALGTKAFKTRVRICQEVQEAQSRRVPLFEWAPKCNASLDYENFIREYIGAYEKTGESE